MVSLYMPAFDVRDTLAVVHGYITSSLKVATSLNSFNANVAVNDIADTTGGRWELVMLPTAKKVYADTRQIVKPVVYIEGLDVLGDGMQYKIE